MVLTFTATNFVEHTTTKYLEDNEDIRKAFNPSVTKLSYTRLKALEVLIFL
ncbi:hypothetical protein [Staphylococcus hominis]|uniref:hypothetical protein n=1 Tax=Staphylococcus hominis TaxID=1290 RepID=UPI000A5A5ABB|nr:hypothetical protein [Staphylococcus hominis]WRY65577.1 hypothetical protein P8632_10930 [Staphylococcus hominis]